MLNLSLLRKPWQRLCLWLALPVLAVLTFYAVSQTAPPAFPVVNLSAEPLYAKGTGAKPTISLALSVEFPTTGGQYLGAYSTADKFIGYFDTESCYTYVNDANANLRRFDRIGAANARKCGGTGFSGNFMNWATGSAIDVLRLGLTGGDRIVDTAALTVMQRAVIPSWFYNSSNFPVKTISAQIAADAVPSQLRGTWGGDIKIANCLNRIYFGTNQSGNCDDPQDNGNLGVAGGAANTTALSSDRFFFTRARVCESTGGVLQDPRAEYCLKYTAGNYKPIGNLQKYSDRVRVAAFGYLMDHNYQRYGGVLRAPMKFLGPNNYDGSGSLVTSPNPGVEWDTTTGVFLDNPENNTTQIAGTLNNGLNSGVINYLNKFGRTGPNPGTYKTYDPVTELYYETLRYVQGLQPTPQAISGINDYMKDGFAVYTNWTDPHAAGSSTASYSCLKNNIIAIGDANTHADKSVPGNYFTTADDFQRTANLAANEPDFRHWTNVVGGFEAKSSVSYLDANSISRNTNHPADTNPPNTRSIYPNLQDAQPPCCTNNGFLMSGIAYWANTHDIRGQDWVDTSKRRIGMRAKTYVIDVNEYGGSTNSVNRRNNQFFLTAKYGGFNDKSGFGNPYLNASGVLDNSVWQKDAEPGEAKTFYLASSAQAVFNGLNEIFENVTAEGNSIAKGSISTSKITSGGYIYQAKYDPADWSGNILSIPVSAAAGNITIDQATPQWRAATVLNAESQTFLTNDRNIVAGGLNGSTPGNSTPVNFKWSTVDAAWQAALNKATPTSTPDTLGEVRLNFLRGSNVNEGSPFRKRNSLLGDIVNSPIVYSNEFAKNVNTGAYKTFITENTGRPPALFVGANDGMLHAFDASNGKELFGYIPSWLAPKLPALTNVNYNTSQHQSYVDGQIDVAEALVGTAWKTVLLGSTGGGGQGVFALDVSNPARDKFNASKVMWEFTDKDDADLGNVIGKPQILKLRTTKKSSTTTTITQEFEWFAVVPSGVNNYMNDGNASSTGKPALFLLKLNKAAGTAWTLGSNYYKIIIKTDATLSNAKAPGLINFTAAGGSADEAAQIYTGDLHGNLWKLDFDLASVTKSLSSIQFDDLTSGTSNKPLFVAADAAGNSQPISMSPTVVIGPNQGTIVMFGTGKYLESGDNLITGAQTQSVYAVYDAEFTNSSTLNRIPGRGYLQAGSISGDAISVPSFAWGRPISDTDSSQRAGWYVDYTTAGERQVSDFSLFGDRIIFGSIVPPQNINDPCLGGSSNLYTLNIATGSGTKEASTIGLISQPFVLESADAVVTKSDSAGRRTKTITSRTVAIGSTGIKAGASTQTDTIILGRLSWRQINNYNELKNKP
jgi:type IV pilus assembly protein PilY1